MTNIETIEEGKEYLRNNWEDGVNCPCCKQLVKLYKRPFNAGMAYSLILIYKIQKETGDEWVHVIKEFAERYRLTSNTMDYTIPEKWELIEPIIGVRDDGSDRVGKWRLTEKGREFVLGRTSIPKKVFIYNNKVYGFSKEEINIRQALKKKFNYSDLMSPEDE